ncbi:MAG: vitamin K epoxide reductase family protein [Caldilineaceae bacterium]|nr:vitamin K epoxide reductase family protein [Caldilineaceae bacterium]MCB0143306.1 vitamin K epoxide reductase family protein [Caldilineaceae bacterium]
MQRRDWITGALLVIGLFIGIYLSYVKLAHTEPICIGGSSDCSLVQNSAYAYLLGIPVAYLGLLAYIALALLWVAKRIDWQGWGLLATQLFWGVGLFAALFSIYLTYIELFVLGAICQWCVASALVIITIFVLTTIRLRTDLLYFEE